MLPSPRRLITDFAVTPPRRESNEAALSQVLNYMPMAMDDDDDDDDDVIG